MNNTSYFLLLAMVFLAPSMDDKEKKIAAVFYTALAATFAVLELFK